MDELQAASAIGQGDLFRAYESRLDAQGVHAAQVLLTASDIAARTNYLNARQTLRRLLEWGVVPVINENDTTATDEITFGDNDFLAAQVAILLDARLLVLLTDIDGLHSADPRPDARRRAGARGARLRAARGPRDRGPHLGLRLRRDAEQGGGGGDGRGGRDRGGDLQRDARRDAAGGRRRRGSWAPPSRPGAAGRPSFKLWLKHAKPAHGRVAVDEGAARMLRESGSSLLPVGIVAVEGSFDAGDAVEVTSGEEVIGKGIANYSSEEVERIKGLKSSQVRELMPHAAEEAVHRDYFVLA